MKKEIKDKFVTLRLPSTVLDALRQQAVAESRTLQGHVLHCIQKALPKKVN